MCYFYWIAALSSALLLAVAVEIAASRKEE